MLPCSLQLQVGAACVCRHFPLYLEKSSFCCFYPTSGWLHSVVPDTYGESGDWKEKNIRSERTPNRRVHPVAAGGPAPQATMTAAGTQYTWRRATLQSADVKTLRLLCSVSL